MHYHPHGFRIAKSSNPHTPDVIIQARQRNHTSEWEVSYQVFHTLPSGPLSSCLPLMDHLNLDNILTLLFAYATELNSLSAITRW